MGCIFRQKLDDLRPAELFTNADLNQNQIFFDETSFYSVKNVGN
jgi:hypothetical protein